MSGLPSGTVTVLMSDVVGSTAHWSAGRDEAERKLELLDSCITSCVRAHGGHLVKARGEGDSHFAAFDRPSNAVLAAAELQRCHAREEVGVRVAVVMAELEPRHGDYVGLAVNRAARIRNAAHGGQIICTRSVADVAFPLEGLATESLGSYRVKDIPGTIELFQVCGAGLVDSFPPLQTLDTAIGSVMAVAYVDEVASSHRANAMDLPTWQGPLYRALRDAAHEYDGRHLKLMGDGGVAAFEDPRDAVGFARAVCRREEFRFRAGVSVGLVTLVEGELTGLPFYEAANASKRAREGDVVLCPLMQSLVGADQR